MSWVSNEDAEKPLEILRQIARKDRIERQMYRLWRACSLKSDFGDDLWSRGLAVIQRQHGVVIYLSKFEHVGTVPLTTGKGIVIQPGWCQEVLRHGEDAEAGSGAGTQ